MWSDGNRGWPTDAMCASEQGPAQCQTLTSQQYSQRVDSEFAKIAARGVSLLGASGDQGESQTAFDGVMLLCV